MRILELTIVPSVAHISGEKNLAAELNWGETGDKEKTRERCRNNG